MITGNDRFVDPDPAMTAFTAALDDFSEKIIAARSGDRVAIAERNAARLVVLGLLRELAAYVQKTSANDVAVLLSSGFEPTKTPSRHGIPDAPGNIRLSYNGKSGELIVRFKGVNGVRTYCVQVATNAEGPWIPVTRPRRPRLR